jgi:hypothetical protein
MKKSTRKASRTFSFLICCIVIYFSGKSQAPADSSPVWKDGHLCMCFKDAEFDTVVARLARYYGAQVVNPGHAKGGSIHATFYLDNKLQDNVDIIQSILGDIVTMQVWGNVILISEGKPHVAPLCPPAPAPSIPIAYTPIERIFWIARQGTAYVDRSIRVELSQGQVVFCDEMTNKREVWKLDSLDHISHQRTAEVQVWHAHKDDDSVYFFIAILNKETRRKARYEAEVDIQSRNINRHYDLIDFPPYESKQTEQWD